MQGKFKWKKGFTSLTFDLDCSDIHKHFAISFRVPSYDLDLEDGEESVPVQVQLQRRSDGCASDPVTFFYTTKTPTDHSQFDGSIMSQADQSNCKVEQSPATHHQMVYSTNHNQYHHQYYVDEELVGQLETSNVPYGNLPQSQHIDTTNMPLKYEFDEYSSSSAECNINFASEPSQYNLYNIPQYNTEMIQSVNDQNAQPPMMSEYWDDSMMSQQQSVPMILDISQNIVRQNRQSEQSCSQWSTQPVFTSQMYIVK